MGMADISTIEAVLERTRTLDCALPVSVALGEAADWERGGPAPRLPPGIAFLKLGTAGLRNGEGWGERFSAAKRRLAEKASDSGGRSQRWIAVAYADWQLAQGPAPDEVIVSAPALDCAGVLIDTFSKGNKRLLDW